MRATAGPNNRSFSAHNLTLRQFLCACIAAMLLGASAAHSQYLEATIMLPDTLGPLNGPYHLACTDDTAFPRLYIGGTGGLYPGRPPEDSGGVIVAEALTCKRLARIPTGPVRALCYVPEHGKLYVAMLNRDTVRVVDAATNQVISSFPTTSRPTVFQYNRQNDRLYCGGDAISVIDCAADTVVRTIAPTATAFALDSANNRLYVGRVGALTVVDCSADTIVATYPRIDTATVLCYNPTAPKVYAASGDTLYAVDTRGDTIVAALRFPRLASVLACDPSRSRLFCSYVGSTGRLASIDCVADTVVWTSTFGQPVTYLACDEVRSRLYAVYSDPHVFVIDAASGALLATVLADGIPSGTAWCPGVDRVYCLPGGQLLSAVDCAVDSLAGVVPITMSATIHCVDSLDNRLYFAYVGSGPGCIGVADCSLNIVTSYWYPAGRPTALCHNANGNRLYVGSGSDSNYWVDVYACSTNAVQKRIRVSGEVRSLQMHPRLNKLYFATARITTDLNVIDCNVDSIVKVLPVPVQFMRLEPAIDRLVCVGWGWVTVLDCLGDSVLADTMPNWGTIDDVCSNPDDRKIYVGKPYRPLKIVDMDNPAHVETLPTVDAGMRFCYVPNQHKVYWFANDPDRVRSTVRAIDSRTNIVTAEFTVNYHVSGTCLDRTGNFVYCACVDSFALVIDAQADSVLVTIPLPSWTSVREPFAANRRTNRVYVAQYGFDLGRGIPVIRDSMLVGLEELQPAVGRPSIGPTVASRGAPLHVAISAGLYDAVGRRAVALGPGLNDISRLSPGVYFLLAELQATSRKPQAIGKLVIAR